MTTHPMDIRLLASFIFVYSLLTIQHSNAQQDFDVACRNSLPFCSSNTIELPPFKNTTGDLVGLNEVGCLNTAPNPSWYFIRIDQPGNLVFEIQQWEDLDSDNRLDRSEIELDVDCIAWGPFQTSFLTNCSDMLSRGCDNNGDGENIQPAECENNIDSPSYYINNEDNTNIVDCSYAREGTETLSIIDAKTGEYYLFLITNFSDRQGVIALEQTNSGNQNAGTTDCTILDPGVGPDLAVCGTSEFPIMVEGRYPDAVSFLWSRAPLSSPSNFTNLGVTTPFLEISSSLGEGVYRLQGLTASGIQATGSPDELVVVDVSDAIVAVQPTVSEESFSGNYTITSTLSLSTEISESNLEAFEFKLDRALTKESSFREYRPYQSNAVFTEIPPGDYRVVARYRNCESSAITSETVTILGYPKFFTPNGDGFHDTWSLINIENLTTSSIYIFDRHGKMLIQLIPGGLGWDGTFKGKNMPSSDYWFRVEFNEPNASNNRRRTFVGNFSLIR